MIAVFDATPLIAFLYDIGDPSPLRLLSKAGIALWAPSHVCRHEVRKEPGAGLLSQLIDEGVLAEIPAPAASHAAAFRARHQNLGDGESHVILAAQNCVRQGEAVWCIIDEEAGREVAEEYGLDVHGTLGLISLLASRKLISAQERQRLLGLLYNSNFWVEKGLIG